MVEGDRAASEREARRVVYVVDPDESIRRSMRALLGTLDVQVATFASAEDFLEGFEPRSAGCVITEALLPGLSGLDLQQSLAATASDVPIIILVSRANTRTAACAMSKGALDCIEKPFVDPRLLSRVREALARTTVRSSG
jgi:FixJ family two-component response regulator